MPVQRYTYFKIDLQLEDQALASGLHVVLRRRSIATYCMP